MIVIGRITLTPEQAAELRVRAAAVSAINEFCAGLNEIKARVDAFRLALAAYTPPAEQGSATA